MLPRRRSSALRILCLTRPAGNFISVSRCVTYLLFPFVTGNNFPGFTTGLAIANTSSDDAAFVTGGGVAASRTATAQAGSITLYGWHGSTLDATGSSTTTFTPSTFTGAAVTSVVSANLNGGDTWAGVIDGAPAFAAFQGYVIAKCDFQYAHGFSFIVGKYNIGSVFDVAHGYLALVIPDPSIIPRRRERSGKSGPVILSLASWFGQPLNGGCPFLFFVDFFKLQSVLTVD